MVAIASPFGVLAQAGSATPDPLERPALKSSRAGNAVLLAVTRAGPRLVAVGERGIVLLSDDNGASWRQAEVPVSVTLTSVRFVNADNGWAVGHSGVVLHTRDGGATWIKQLDGVTAAQAVLAAARGASQREQLQAQRLVSEGPDKPLFDVYFADENRGLAVGAHGLCFATRDGGGKWEPCHARLANPSGKHLYAISALGSRYYIAGEQGALYRSIDGGANFVELQTPYAGSYFGVLQTLDSVLVYGLRGNAFWSGDGRAWHRIALDAPATLTAGVARADGSVVLVDQGGRVLLSGGAADRDFRPLTLSPTFPLSGVAAAADGSLVVAGARGIVRVPIDPSSHAATSGAPRLDRRP
jgi:photosystem II stability/assembly factor-like uncharacterized protein